MGSDDPPNRRQTPGVAISVVSRRGRLPLARTRIARLARRALGAAGRTPGLLTIDFVGPRTIARLHRELVGVAGVTDIVTLEHQRVGRGAPLVGEVYIAPDVAAAHARRLGVPVRDEIARLVVHGVLHVLGWEHPDGADRERSPMWRRQERILAAARRAGEVA